MTDRFWMWFLRVFLVAIIVGLACAGLRESGPQPEPNIENWDSLLAQMPTLSQSEWQAIMRIESKLDELLRRIPDPNAGKAGKEQIRQDFYDSVVQRQR